MFDPTAFDNMKVVIEGALYDLDLIGAIIVTDRNDFLNTAKMSRLFSICFRLPGNTTNTVTAKLEMGAELNNLAAELLPNMDANDLAGCFVKLQFCLEVVDEMTEYQEIDDIFRKIWGEERKICQSVEFNPLNQPKKMKNVVTIDFERIISEAQMDDLVEMIEFMVTTTQQLETFCNGRK
ncbi:hypothetical protein HPT25_24570 [Bacillus sp. BRMEA1]|uniref:hypothetical protein n=1 Tax=Neobacillus endophyticus TaxID=2738405 RepID=UPI001567C56F|nr:hypothetical protein [Neobacillus endophyticus]NRD80501.1 hypothetical protein [Neobacillus endophyticus]